MSLVVHSKIKQMIRVKADFNTSGKALDELSEVVEKICDKATDIAADDGRKTVMDRDIKKAWESLTTQEV